MRRSVALMAWASVTTARSSVLPSFAEDFSGAARA